MTKRLILAVAILAAQPIHAAEPQNFSAAVAAAERLSSTPAYQQYEWSKFWPAIGTAFANAMVACTKTLKADVTFDCVFIVAADGHIQRILQSNIDDMVPKRKSIFWGRVLDGSAPPIPRFQLAQGQSS